ncbi:hypothetical protein QO034_01900 [Sedimentitalea sp. JM2-8]|uniref:DUF1127 domain-containing protein n=1 Tax=Sedimentitalea xiamensis TaxID=3050037 RepID=A0ABT7F9S3_9RHOB|nr:hypothetical protein [Sedimentitalea xiamensis]MDK3071851.1 hypothetical protein [Sedimentitalea xiamensis]
MRNDRISLTFLRPGWLKRLDWFLASQGQGFNAQTLGRSRLHEVAALESLSDGELMKLGLCRNDIPAFVFSDLLEPGPKDRKGGA